MKVEDFIYGQDETVQKILLHFHELLQVEFNLQPKIRFKIPFYFNNSWVCYLNPIKGDGVELAFTRANELSNSSGILDFKDRKQIAGIEIYKLETSKLNAVYEVLQEAILLDENVPYASKRVKKK